MSTTVRLLDRATVRAMTAHLPKADVGAKERAAFRAAAEAVRTGAAFLSTEEVLASRSENVSRDR